MATFWDTLVTSGQEAATKVLSPLAGGLVAGFSNLVQAGQNKVGSISQTIAQTTDPNNKSTKSQPPTPPTTGTPPAKNALSPGSPLFASGTTLAILAGIVILYFVMRKK